MFKRAAIKRYGHRLQPKLNKRYGEQSFYSARQVRATVYQCNFNPSYLPLGYLLFLDKPELTDVCSGQLILATDLYSSQYLFSDSLGVSPPL